MKKMLAMLLLALCLLPAMAGAETIDITGKSGKVPITKDGSTITGSANGVYLVAESGVKNLTFENVNVTAPDGLYHGLQLDASGEVKLTFIGDNNVLTGGNTSDPDWWGGDGIHKEIGSLIIEGNVTANGGRAISSGCNGIFASGGVKIHGNVTANGSDGESGGDGIYAASAGDVIVDADSTLTVKAGMSTIPLTDISVEEYGDKCGSGIYAMDGAVTIKGALTITQSGSGIYMENGNVTIGGKVDIQSVKGAIRTKNLAIENGTELMGRADKNAEWTPILSETSASIFYTMPIAHTKPLPVDDTEAGTAGSEAEGQTGDLPKTGYASMLGMWACLLAASGAAMKARRKR